MCGVQRNIEEAHALMRAKMRARDNDREFANDIETTTELVRERMFERFVPGLLPIWGAGSYSCRDHFEARKNSCQEWKEVWQEPARSSAGLFALRAAASSPYL